MKNAINPYSYQHGLGSSKASVSFDVLPENPSSGFSLYANPVEVINYLTPQTVVSPTYTPPKVLNNVVDNSATMTLNFQVVDKLGPLPAKVVIDNQVYAATNEGFFKIPNVKINSIVTISLLSYKSLTAKASQIPSKVVLELTDEAIALETFYYQNSKPKSKTNWLALLGIAAAVTVAYKYANKEEAPKRVKAKI